MSEQTASPRQDSQRGRPRRRRRWLVGLGVLLAVLVVLVALSPYIVSTGPVTGLIVHVVNGRIKGRISIDELSIGWGGPSRIRGLSVTDADGKEVLKAESIAIAGGLWRFITSAVDFESVELARPEISIRLRPDGTITLAEAFSSSEPPRKRPKRPPREPKPLPKPTGSIVLRDGVVRVETPTGRSYELTGVNSRIEINTLSTVLGDLVFRLPEAGQVRAEFKLANLADEMKFKPDDAVGNVSIFTEEQIDLAPAGRFAGLEALAGRLGLRFEVALDKGETDGRFDIAATDLQAGGEGHENLRPVDLSLDGSMKAAGGSYSGSVRLSGDCGQMASDFAYHAGGGPFDLSPNALMDAALSGKELSLPDFLVSLMANIDLPKLARAVPALLAIRPGVSVTAGALEIKSLELRGGARPVAKGLIVLSGVEADRDGRKITLEPISATLDAGIEPGKGLRLGQTEINAGFAQLSAFGTASRLNLEWKADLHAARQQLGEIFELGEWGLAGIFWGSLDAGRVAERQAAFIFGAEAGVLSYKRGQRELQVRHAVLDGEGRLTWRQGGGLRLEMDRSRLAADDYIDVSGSGWFDSSNKSFSVDFKVSRAAIEGLARKAQGMGYGQAVDYSGSAVIKASVSRASAEAPVATSGNLEVNDFLWKGDPLVGKLLRFDWADLKIEPAKRKFSVAKAELLSDAATATADNIAADLGGDLRLDGILELSANLGPCAEIYERIREKQGKAKKAEPPELAGKLTWSGNARTEGGKVSFDGKGRIDGLEITSRGKTVSERQVRFDQSIGVDTAAEVITFRRFELDSEPLRLTVTPGGTIRQYKTQRVLDIRGSYSGSWQRLTEILHQFVPALAEDVAFEGPLASGFEITGPLNRPQLKPVFYEARAQSAVPWQQAMLFGIRAGQVEFRPQLNEGQVLVPLVEMDANGGKMRLGATVDMRAGEPVLNMPGATAILEDVQLDPEVGKKLLSRFNPIFADMVQLEGKINLAIVEPIMLPLKKGSELPCAGSGRLDLGGLKVQPKGLLADLMQFVGLAAGESRSMEIGSVDFRIEQGRRIAYDNFTVTFGGVLDLKFYGSVGLDDTVDMAVSIPVRAALLERFGVQGPLLDYARVLEGARVDIPITGTRLKPKLSPSRKTIESLVAKAVEALLKEEVAKRLKDLLNRGKSKPPATTQPAPATPEELLLQGIFNVLEQVNKQRQKPKDAGNDQPQGP